MLSPDEEVEKKASPEDNKGVEGVAVRRDVFFHSVPFRVRQHGSLQPHCREGKAEWKEGRREGGREGGKERGMGGLVM